MNNNNNNKLYKTLHYSTESIWIRRKTLTIDGNKHARKWTSCFMILNLFEFYTENSATAKHRSPLMLVDVVNWRPLAELFTQIWNHIFLPVWLNNLILTTSVCSLDCNLYLIVLSQLRMYFLQVIAYDLLLAQWGFCVLK